MNVHIEIMNRPFARFLAQTYSVDRMLIFVLTGVSYVPQLATQAGNLNVPQWYESGKIIAEAHPEIPQRASPTHPPLPSRKAYIFLAKSPSGSLCLH